MTGLIHRDLLFPAEPLQRQLARRLYAGIEHLPIVSPHGHTDPSWYARNEPFPDPAQLLIVPDHYIFRMLFSQGARLEKLGVPACDGSAVETDGRAIWRLFAEHYYLFRGTPTRLWFDYVLSDLFGIEEPLSAKTADRCYDAIAERLQREAYRPRAGFATSTDHGHPTAETANLTEAEATQLFDRTRQGTADERERRLFRAQMLTEMAKMSRDDGLVMQIYPGFWRDHSPKALQKFGRDKGFDIPTRTDYVAGLKPLLDCVGLEPDLTVILFTLDESSYARELAPVGRGLSGAQARPCLVVPRQSRRHAPFPRNDHRDRGLLQHRRLQRRNPRFSLNSGTPRRGAPGRLRILGAPRFRASPERGRMSLRRNWPTRSPRGRIGCERAPRR